MHYFIDKIMIQDYNFFQYLYKRYRRPSLIRMMYYISFLGGASFTLLLTFILILFGENEIYRLGWQMLLALSSSYLFVHCMKRIVNRPRPYKMFNLIDLFKIPAESYSFPSGHTTSSFALALTISYYFPKLSLLCFSLAVLVGFSRIYLGVHYPSDVIIGALTGITFSIIVNICFYYVI